MPLHQTQGALAPARPGQSAHWAGKKPGFFLYKKTKKPVFLVITFFGRRTIVDVIDQGALPGRTLPSPAYVMLPFFVRVQPFLVLLFLGGFAVTLFFFFCFFGVDSRSPSLQARFEVWNECTWWLRKHAQGRQLRQWSPAPQRHFSTK